MAENERMICDVVTCLLWLSRDAVVKFEGFLDR